MATSGDVSNAASQQNDKNDNLEWVIVSEYLSRQENEGLRGKLIRKTKENPLVPVGILATTAALTYGLWSMKSGDVRKSQLMMRFRVFAQGFTVAAIIVGMAIAANKTDPKGAT